jgi:hypothetical protein
MVFGFSLVRRRLGVGGGIFSNKVSSAPDPSRLRRRDRSSWSFIDGYFFFFVSGTDVIFLTRSATSHPQPATSGNSRRSGRRGTPSTQFEG